MKLFCCILLGSLFSCSLSAQVRKENDWKKLFGKESSGSSHSGYRLIKTVSATDKKFLEDNGVKLIRQLSDSECIVQLNDIHLAVSIPGLLDYTEVNDNWKCSPPLLDAIVENIVDGDQPKKFYLLTNDIPGISQQIKTMHRTTRLVCQYQNIVIIETSLKELIAHWLPGESISFVDFADRQPKEEVSIIGFDNSTNAVNKLHAYLPQINGSGMVVSVKENKPDTTDIDFKGRYVSTPQTSINRSTHATIMSTIIAGGGNSSYTALGVAWKAAITSSSFDVLLPDSNAVYRQQHISVQNHSYGTGVENFYGADALAYDSSVISNPYLLHIFSSGNSGNLASNNGNYAGITGWANLTGSFKMAKNIITVGSIDSFGFVPVLSSKGPAYDGRVKPELVAFGEDGSSGAAALVSGTVMAVQQLYKNIHTDSLPDASLVKAILLNSADDIGNAGIDFSSGYGNMNAYAAVQDLQTGHFFQGTISGGQLQSYTITVPPNAKHLKVLLAWSDKPAVANNFKALVNDLDLTVTYKPGGQTWQPWVLNSFPQGDSIALLPVRKRDSLNPVEQVTVDDPLPGSYTISVSGFSVTPGPQLYSIVYRWDTANTFEWNYPTAGDNLVPKQQNVLRWKNNYASAGLLEYSYAGTNNWQAVASSVDLSKRFFKWLTPDTNAVVLLRMSVNGVPYLSDTITISSKLQTGVGFNCTDSILLYWNKMNTNNYVLYQLGDQYLQPFREVADSSVILRKAAITEKWFAVAPRLPFDRIGSKGFSFNYEDQGVGCYIRNFTADIVNTVGQLTVSLGTTYMISRVTIEKLTNTGYRVLQNFGGPVLLQYNVADNQLSKGVNTYRAKLELSNGAIIYSEPETIYYLNKSNYLIYPNPVRQQQPFNIISSELGNAVFQLFNAYGQKVLEKTLFNLYEQTGTGQLGKGIYFFIIWKDGKKDMTGKLIIQ